MSMTPQELQKLLDELEASRSSRRRAWENLQEIRWVLKDSAHTIESPHQSLMSRHRLKVAQREFYSRLDSLDV